MWGIAADYVLYGVCLGLSLLMGLLSIVGGISHPAAGHSAGHVGHGIDHGHGAHHAHGHHGVDGADHGVPRYSLLNPVAFLSFLGGVGATGLIVRGLGVGTWWSLLLALSGGTLLSWVLFQLFARVVLAGEGGAAYRPEAAIGKLATVTVSLPAGGQGTVTYVANGKWQTLAARQQGGQPLERGAEVAIVDLEGNVAIVKPFVTQKKVVA